MTSKNAIELKTTSNSVGIQKLLLCIGCVAIVWLVLLPKLASQSRLEARLKWLQDNRIDPSAMYYTELEAMEPILKKLNAKQRKPLTD